MTHRIAAIQMTSTQDVKTNLTYAANWIEVAAQQGAKLIALPEMFAMIGVDQADKIKISESFGQGPIQDFLSEQAKKHHIWLVGGTIPLKVDNQPEKSYAACLLYDDTGKVVAHYNKIHLFDVKINATQETYQESKNILAGDQIVVADTPIGKVGLAVCYDLRFPEMFRLMHDQGVEMIVLPAAFTFATGLAHWEVLLRARAIENQVYVLAAAQAGVHSKGRKTWGHSMLVDPWGVVQACLPIEPGMMVAEVDLAYLKRLRDEFPVLEHKQLLR